MKNAGERGKEDQEGKVIKRGCAISKVPRGSVLQGSTADSVDNTPEFAPVRT